MKDKDILDLMARLNTLLSNWIQGQLDEREVHEAAEQLLEGEFGWQDFDRSDPRSAVMAVLLQLDVLNVQWITKSDAPAMINFMKNAFSDPQTAWDEWERYWESVDLEERKRSLKRNQYYFP